MACAQPDTAAARFKFDTSQVDQADIAAGHETQSDGAKQSGHGEIMKSKKSVSFQLSGCVPERHGKKKSVPRLKDRTLKPAKTSGANSEYPVYIEEVLSEHGHLLSELLGILRDAAESGIIGSLHRLGGIPPGNINILLRTYTGLQRGSQIAIINRICDLLGVAGAGVGGTSNDPVAIDLSVFHDLRRHIYQDLEPNERDIFLSIVRTGTLDDASEIVRAAVFNSQHFVDGEHRPSVQSIAFLNPLMFTEAIRMILTAPAPLRRERMIALLDDALLDGASDHGGEIPTLFDERSSHSGSSAATAPSTPSTTEDTGGEAKEEEGKEEKEAHPFPSTPP